MMQDRSMKRRILNTISQSGRMFSLQALLNTAKKNSIYLLYHTVNDEVPPHIKHLYRPRTTAEFGQDIDSLARYFNFISTAEIATNTITGGKRSVHLSFDDGLSSCYDTIRPLLLQKGIPATFFINPAFIGNNKMFHCHKASLLREAFLQKRTTLKNVAGEAIRGEKFLKTITAIQSFSSAYYQNLAGQLGVNFEAYLRQYQPYLSVEQIKKMKEEGFEFGSHSLTHPLFASLSQEDQLTEITRSLQWLKDNHISDEKYFAFPFSDVGIGRDLFLKLRELGISQSFGTSDMKVDILASHHHRISFENSGNEAASILKQQLFKYILLKLIGRHKIERR